MYAGLLTGHHLVCDVSGHWHYYRKMPGKFRYVHQLQMQISPVILHQASRPDLLLLAHQLQFLQTQLRLLSHQEGSSQHPILHPKLTHQPLLELIPGLDVVLCAL